jgi:Ran GTPase-activating protein (RanGAP) involved in mRNA processing and transport
MGTFFSKEPQSVSRSFSVAPRGQVFDEESIEAIIKDLEENTHNISEISIGSNTYTQDSLLLLSNTIQECQNLISVDFSDVIHSINSPDLLEILNSTLLCLHNLYEVNLSKNNLTEDTIDILSFLFHSDYLKVLILDDNLLGIEGSMKLAEAFRNSELELFVFRAQRNRLEDQGVIELSEAFSNMKSLRQVSLSENRLGKEGVMIICKSMINNLDLQVLELCDSYMNEEIAYGSLRNLIEKLKYLSKISLNDCFLGNEGSKMVLTALIDHNPNLLELHLGYNEMDQDEIGILIVSLLKTKKFLEVMLN